jgi:hypothetical protein
MNRTRKQLTYSVFLILSVILVGIVSMKSSRAEGGSTPST